MSELKAQSLRKRTLERNPLCISVARELRKLRANEMMQARQAADGRSLRPGSAAAACGFNIPSLKLFEETSGVQQTQVAVFQLIESQLLLRLTEALSSERKSATSRYCMRKTETTFPETPVGTLLSLN